MPRSAAASRSSSSTSATPRSPAPSTRLALATGAPPAAGPSEAAGSGYDVQVAAPASVAASGTEAAGASKLWGRGTVHERRPASRPAVDLGRVVRERAAVLLPADSPKQPPGPAPNSRRWPGTCAGSASTATRSSGYRAASGVPAPALAELLRDGPDAGLSVLIGTTSPQTAAELSGLTGATLSYPRHRPGPGRQPRRADRHPAAPARGRGRTGRPASRGRDAAARARRSRVPRRLSQRGLLRATRHPLPLPRAGWTLCRAR